MIITKEKVVTEKVVDHIICDSCGLKYTPENYEDWQEILCLRFTGGYGSVFGDGTTMEAQICQLCVRLLLGNILRETEDEDVCDC
jgi:hypothetical protein